MTEKGVRLSDPRFGSGPPLPPLRGVLFDLDGTLIDSAKDIATGVRLALQDLDLEPPTLDEVRLFIGDGVQNLIERCLRGRGSIDLAVARFRHHYDAHALDTTDFFPHLRCLLEALTIPLAVISNKPEAFCNRILDGLSARHIFRHVSGGDSHPERKPSPLPLRIACEALDVDPKDAVMVGDGPQDMRAAAALPMPALGVLWGQSTRETLEDAGASRIVETPEELSRVLSAT